MKQKKLHWAGEVLPQSLDTLRAPAGFIVSPTKVGYIIMVTDCSGLKRKFSAKKRNLNKPGVILCSSVEQLSELAQLNPEIESFYQHHWDNDILLGCILPWKASGMNYILDDGSKDFVMDQRGTSCFVIKFGVPSEQITKEFWDNDRELVFASSANPSGKGNRGVIQGIGERIENEADLLIEADDYVHSIQSGKDAEARYEQGVMVSMVDAEGKLIPEQGVDERNAAKPPMLIRKGLDLTKIMSSLSDHFNSWDYRHGCYY